MFTLLNKYRKHIPPVIDVFIAQVSYVLPYFLTGIEPVKVEIIHNTVFIYALIYLITFYMLSVYKNMWRYTGIFELYTCLRASILANIVFYFTAKAFNLTVFNYVFIFATVSSTLLSLSARVMFRALLIIFRNRNNFKKENKMNVMIVGAGQATSIMLGCFRDVKMSQSSFLDLP